MSRGVSRITSVIGAIVSVVAVLSGIHQHMVATLAHRRGGYPGDVAIVIGASVCIGTIGHISVSAISTDLEIAIGVVVPGAQSSADVVLATVSVASSEGALAGVVSFLNREAFVGGRLSVIAAHLSTGSVDTQFGGGIIVAIHLCVDIISRGGSIVETVSDGAVSRVRGLDLGVTLSIGGDVEAVDGKSITFVVDNVTGIEGASVSVLAVGISDAFARARVLLALSGGGITRVDSARQ